MTTPRHEIIGDGVDVEQLFCALAAEPGDLFWLDGGGSRPSYLGRGAPVSLGEPLLPELRARIAQCNEPDGSGLRSIGLVGWLNFGLTAETTGVPVPREGASSLLRVTEAIAVDPWGVARLLIRPGAPDSLVRDRTRALRAQLARLPRVPDRSPARVVPGGCLARWRDSATAYSRMISECQRLIRDGEAYVMCLTTRVTVQADLDPARVYVAVRRANGTHRSAFIRIGDTALLSTSPEQFLRVSTSGLVLTSPIKGTRPRSTDPAADRSASEELRTNVKERAENVMIVDLMRNDLATVCSPGSVRVRKLFEVQSFPQVHQLVSEVQGRLAPGRDAVDAVDACFPAGSMTGAPKRRALEHLARIESGPRGVYSGAFGFFGFDGSAELAMTIRSMVYSRGRVSIGTGGGITALSDPAAEVSELEVKVRPLLTAIGVLDTRMPESADHPGQPTSGMTGAVSLLAK